MEVLEIPDLVIAEPPAAVSTAAASEPAFASKQVRISPAARSSRIALGVFLIAAVAAIVFAKESTARVPHALPGARNSPRVTAAPSHESTSDRTPAMNGDVPSGSRSAATSDVTGPLVRPERRSDSAREPAARQTPGSGIPTRPITQQSKDYGI